MHVCILKLIVGCSGLMDFLFLFCLFVCFWVGMGESLKKN